MSSMIKPDSPNLDAAISSRLATVLNTNIQSGYVSGDGIPGSGEDAYYIDITIAAVNPAKSIVILHPCQYTVVSSITARLIGSSTLRMAASNVAQLAGRWQVVEYK